MNRKLLIIKKEDEKTEGKSVNLKTYSIDYL